MDLVRDQSPEVRDMHERQLEYICWALQALCADFTAFHVQPQDLSVNESVQLLAAILDVPCYGPFGGFDTQKMSHALGHSEIYREGMWLTDHEVDGMSQRLVGHVPVGWPLNPMV